MDIIVRAYNEGIAFRYHLPEATWSKHGNKYRWLRKASNRHKKTLESIRFATKLELSLFPTCYKHSFYYKMLMTNTLTLTFNTKSHR